MRKFVAILGLMLVLAACDDAQLQADLNSIEGVRASETGRVVRVIDGDTIDVKLSDGQEVRVRYIGVNTPERDEPCYEEATVANRNLVEGQDVLLVKDVSDTDQYDRLLRYVYVGNTLVNGVLVQEGWAEAVRYDPDTRHYEAFRQLEQQAAAENLGCQPTGIFDDSSSRR